MADFLQDDCARIASLVVHGLSDEQLCQVVGIDQQTLDLVRESEFFKDALREKSLVKFQREAETVEGWDRVEHDAINNVLEAMKWNKNPEFSLRAAAVANRAERRNSGAVKPIDGQRVGQVVVINLSQNFVEKLNGALDVSVERVREMPQRKQVDLPTPKVVQRLLTDRIGVDDHVGLARGYRENIDLDKLAEIF